MMAMPKQFFKSLESENENITLSEEILTKLKWGFKSPAIKCETKENDLILNDKIDRDKIPNRQSRTQESPVGNRDERTRTLAEKREI